MIHAAGVRDRPPRRRGSGVWEADPGPLPHGSFHLIRAHPVHFCCTNRADPGPWRHFPLLALACLSRFHPVHFCFTYRADPGPWRHFPHRAQACLSRFCANRADPGPWRRPAGGHAKQPNNKRFRSGTARMRKKRSRAPGEQEQDPRFSLYRIKIASGPRFHVPTFAT